MAKNNESTGRTLTVVILLCLICSVIVAGSAVGLKARQEQQKLLDKQMKILQVTGLMQPELSSQEIQTLYQQRIEPKLLDLKSGQLVDQNPANFDMQAALKDPSQSQALSAQEDKAGIRRITTLAEIYLVKNSDSKIEQIVLPVHGTGLWSVMYAFVAINPDGNTVRGLTYYKHGETPGLGGEIENPNWVKKWGAKKLFDEHGRPAIHIVKGGAKPGDMHGIDALSGATLTSNGVQNTFTFWLGDNGYGPFLKNVREGALNHG